MLNDVLFENHRHLLAAFEAVGSSKGHAINQIRELFMMLPCEIRGAPAAISKIDKCWHYSFGKPYDRLPAETIVVGTPQMPLVDFLYDGLIAIKQYLSQHDQEQFLRNLAQEEKHSDFLAELTPLLHISNETKVTYEVSGFGEDKIDWQFLSNGFPPILLDVKRRHGDLIGHISDFIQNKEVGKSEDEIKPPNPVLLFKSVIGKFSPSSPDIQLQGVWIKANIAQVEADLRNYFDSLDASRLHFAALASDDDEAYILARNDEIKLRVLNFFRLRESRRYVR
jgi:hypothetical protein